MKKNFRFKKDQANQPSKDAAEELNPSPALDAAAQARLMAEKNHLVNSLQNLSNKLSSLDTKCKELALAAKMVEVYLNKMFPDQMAVDELVYEIDQFKSSQLKVQNAYTPQYLIFHTRDQAWLTNYAFSVITRNNSAGQPVTIAEVSDYIKTAPAFTRAVRAFEQRVVKAYIRANMREVFGEYEFLPTKPLHESFHGEYDKYMRQAVITSARLVGLDRHTAEVGLEQNPDLWREKTMKATLECNYFPDSDQPTNPFDRDDWLDLKAKYQDVWLREREYQYYQEHKALIDELGVATPNMLMDQQSADQLHQIVDNYENLRQIFKQKNNEKQAQKNQEAANEPLEVHTL